MNKKLLFILMIIGMFLISGCMQKISEAKTEENVGKKVTVRGTVENTIKIGSISGYSLKDDTGTIAVSSKTLPEEGTTKTTTGILIKDTLLGYYVKED